MSEPTLDVLDLYVDRILLDDPARTWAALSAGLISLRDETRGLEPVPSWALDRLTELGEKARPLADEGVPCER